MKALLVIFLLVILAVDGKNSKVISPVDHHRRCTTDADCKCGVHVRDRANGLGNDLCFVGRKEFVTTPPPNTCLNFCHGKRGELVFKCMEESRLPFKICRHTFSTRGF